MKKRKIRTVAAALAAIMTLALSPVAGASQALGTEIHNVTQTLSEGVEVTRQYLWSATYSDLRTEHYLTYTPSEGIRPTLVYGDTVVSKETLTTMAKRLEKEGKRVLGGINGDYYVVATGAPLGMVITEGELRSTPQYDTSWALGFFEDGTAFISQPELSVTASFHGQTLSILGGINKVRSEQGGYYLLTEDFAANTLNTSPGIDVILRPLSEGLGDTVEVRLPVTEDAVQADDPGEEALSGSEELTGEDLLPEEATKETATVAATAQTVSVTRSNSLKINSRVSCEVVEVLHSESKLEIPEGCYVLTINQNGNTWLREQLASLAPGERVELDIVSADVRWNDAVTAIGGMYKLVTDGQVEGGLDNTQAPRSAVGIKADGSTVFYTVDGRQSGYSVGVSLTQVAQRLVELGCVEAVCLDGGGSTTLGVTWPDSDSFTAINRPSDGSQRANSNALFLVSERKATGRLDRYYITPNDDLVLSGASVQLSASGVDTNGFPMESGRTLSWSVTEGDGSVTADGLFTAGEKSGLVTVTVTDGEKSGSVCIQVVHTPTGMALSNGRTGASVTSLHLEPGQSIDLTAKLTYWGLPLVGADENCVWTLDPAVGTVDEKGVICAASSNGTGYLTVSAGEKSLSIPVTVSSHILPLESFESGVGRAVSTDTAAVVSETDLEKVRFGDKSAKISYQATEGKAIFGAVLPITAGEKLLSLWIYGNGSGHRLTASFADSSGSLMETEIAWLDFSGWQQVWVQLPEVTVSLQSIAIYCDEKGAQSGIFWLDQLTTSNGRVTDEQAPVIELMVENGILQAVITDEFDGAVAAERISVTLDGHSLSFTWDEVASRLTLALPQGTGQLHRVSIVAADISGNLSRASYDYAEGTDLEEPFLDMEGHWAESYAAYLYQQGVTTGVAVEGGYEFQPDKAISRGEFALMMTRWMGLEVDAYADVELPFADLDQIPDWMLPAVRAMYAEGIMKGSQVGGKVCANATQSISRAETMTLLGRIQSKGYPTEELTFTDAGQVPAWALEHIKSLVAQGVVNGYNGMIAPNALVTRGEVAKMLVALM